MLTRHEKGKIMARTEYSLLFTLKNPIRDIYGDVITGYSIDCDENGIPLPSNIPEMMANYRRCMSHPEKFEVFNELVVTKNE